MVPLLLTFGMTCAKVYKYLSNKIGLLFQAHMLHRMGHYSPFSKVTGYRLDAWSSVHGRCIGIFLLLNLEWPVVQWVLAALSPGLKWPDIEVDHLHAYSAEV
jgi:hypothetical protein